MRIHPSTAAPPAGSRPVGPDVSHRTSSGVATRLGIAAVAVGWAVAVACTIDVRALWVDETTSERFAALPWPALRSFVARYDPMFGEYYALLHLWNFAGTSAAWERLLSVVFATAALAVVFAVASGRFDRRVGLAATAALACDPVFLHAATEARPYALTSLGFAATLALWDRARRDDRPGTFVALAAAAIATLYAHAMAFFGLAALFATLALPPLPTPRNVRRLLIVALVVAVAAYPIVWLVSHAFAPQDDWQQNPRSLRAAAYVLAETVSGTLRPLPAALVFFAAGLVACARGRRTRDAAVLVALIVVPIAAVAALSIVRPLFVPRYLAYTAVPACIVIGRGIVALYDARRAYRIAAVVLAAYLVVTGVQGGRQMSGDGYDWGAVAATVQRGIRPGDGLAVLPGFQIDPLRYAANGGLDATPVFPTDRSLAALLESRERFDAGAARAVRVRYGRIWLITVPRQVDVPVVQPVLARLLARAYRRRWSARIAPRDGDVVLVERYDRRPAASASR